MLQKQYKNSIIAIFLIFFLTSTACAETYVQLNGISVHNRPGFNEFNYGAGIEQTVTDRWSVAGGWFRNSEYRGSTYAYARYAVYKNGPWNIGVAAGLVTGYESYTVAPFLFPEACYSYFCAVALPQVKTGSASALAFHLRVPI
jgi:hypothetical protein